MKALRVIVAVVTAALAVAGCYWTPHAESQSGGIVLSVTLPRGVAPSGLYWDAFRVYLYDSADVSALYGPVGSEPSNPKPTYRDDDIAVTPTGKPIPIEGYDHYDFILGESLSSSSNGSFTISNIPLGRKYRIHMQYGAYDPAPDFYGNWEGVSEAFEVPAGGAVDVGLDLYYSPKGFGY
jgi:hypothetical protein